MNFKSILLVGGVSQPYDGELHLRERIAREVSSQEKLPKLFHVVRLISLARRGTHKHNDWLIRQPRLSDNNRIITTCTPEMRIFNISAVCIQMNYRPYRSCPWVELLF